MTYMLADFSWAKPNGRTLKALGYSGVVGYVSGNSGKDLSKSQVQTYRSDGLAVGFVNEGTGTEELSRTRAVQGAITGDRLMNSYGVPSNVALFLAVDFNPSVHQLPVIAANVWAARMSVVRPVGVYGSYALLRYLYDHGKIVWGWQTYAWSSGHLDPRAQFYQYSNNHSVAGGTIDFDRSNSLSGLWLPSVAPHPYPGRLLQETTSTHVDPEVILVQQQLNHKMGDHLVTDGLFGPLTTTAVKNYQHSHLLTADGIVGPVTWKSLFS